MRPGKKLGPVNPALPDYLQFVFQCYDARGYSLQNIAQEIGARDNETGNISRWRSGKMTPSLSTLEKLGAGVGLRLTWAPDTRRKDG